MSLPSLLALRAFEAAARLGTMRAAAEELGLTPSAISHQVHSLEEQLQVRLFVRRGRSIILTQPGQQYAAAAYEAFGQLRNATQALAAGCDRLRVVVQPTFASEILLPSLDELERRYPKLNLHVEVRSSLPDVLRDPIDMAITYRAKSPQGVFAQELLRAVSSPVASPGLICRLPSPLSRETVAKQTLLFHQPAPDAWQAWFRAAGWGDQCTPRRTLSFDSFPGAVRAAIDGQGLLIAPLQLVAGHLRERRLQRLCDATIPSLGGYFVECRPGEESLDRIATLRRWLTKVVAPLASPPQFE